jgi:hypothetical protein
MRKHLMIKNDEVKQYMPSISSESTSVINSLLPVKMISVTLFPSSFFATHTLPSLGHWRCLLS